MSLQRLLSGKGTFTQELLSHINDVTPRRHQFKKFKNILGYDNSQILIDSAVNDPSLYPCLKDTFLMLVRVVICRHMNIAFNVNDYIGPNPTLYFHEPMIELKYIRFQNFHKQFLNNNLDPMKLVDFCFILACIQNLRITGDAATNNRLMNAPLPQGFIEEIRAMLEVFSNTFFGSQHITHIESFVPAPCYTSSITSHIKNLKPELVVNKTLYLFDVSVMPNIDSYSVHSLVVYYLLRLCEKSLFAQNPTFDIPIASNIQFRSEDINRIAIYKARYGSLEYFDLTDFMKTAYMQSVYKLLKHMGYKPNSEMLEQMFY